MKKGILLIILVTLAACKETMDTKYKDLSEVKSDGAIQRGWIPSWLPTTAHDIKETHNIDTNKSILSWKYKEEEKWQVPKSCERIGPFDAPAPTIRRSWWPPDLPANRYSTYRHVFYKCGDGEFLAIQPSSGEAFFWRH